LKLNSYKTIFTEKKKRDSKRISEWNTSVNCQSNDKELPQEEFEEEIE